MAKRSHLGLSRGQVVNHQDRDGQQEDVGTYLHWAVGPVNLILPTPGGGGVHEVLQAPCSVTSMAPHVPQADLLVLEFWESGRVWDRSPGQRSGIKGGNRCGRPVNMIMPRGSWFSTCPCQHPSLGSAGPKTGYSPDGWLCLTRDGCDPIGSLIS